MVGPSCYNLYLILDNISISLKTLVVLSLLDDFGPYLRWMFFLVIISLKSPISSFFFPHIWIYFSNKVPHKFDFAFIFHLFLSLTYYSVFCYRLIVAGSCVIDG